MVTETNRYNVFWGENIYILHFIGTNFTFIGSVIELTQIHYKRTATFLKSQTSSPENTLFPCDF